MTTPEKFSTAKKIVDATILKMGLDHRRFFLQFLGFAYAFIDEYATEDAGQIKTVALAVHPNRTADLPDDYLHWVRVGQQVGDYIVNLDFNRDLALHTEGGVALPAAPAALPGPYALRPAGLSVFYFMGWDGTSGLAGYGNGGYRREFVVDKAQRQIRLNSALNPYTLYLEYIGSECHRGPGTLIDPMAKMAAEYYILWQYYARKESWASAKQYEGYYYLEREKIVARKSDFDLDEIAAILDDVYGHAPRD